MSGELRRAGRLGYEAPDEQAEDDACHAVGVEQSRESCLGQKPGARHRYREPEVARPEQRRVSADMVLLGYQVGHERLCDWPGSLERRSQEED